MNKQREAIRWSMAIAAAIFLGLVVVWAAIALAFKRLDFAPLYFDTAPYRQDDYSAEGEEVARLNPLDPALEQEVILEDQARGSVVPTVDSSSPTNTPSPKPTNTYQPLPTNTSLPAPTSTSLPAPTSTSLPAPTSTSLPAPTTTSAPPDSTRMPKPTRTPKPVKTPKPTKPPNINNQLGGDVAVGGFRDNLLSALADGLNRIVKANKAVTKTIQEIVHNLLVNLAHSPDLNLLDWQFQSRPGHRERLLSVGLASPSSRLYFSQELYRFRNISSRPVFDPLSQVAEANTP